MLCDTDYYLLDSTCLKACPENYTATGDIKTCKPPLELSQSETKAISVSTTAANALYYTALGSSYAALVLSAGDFLHLSHFGILLSLLMLPKFYNTHLPDNLLLYYQKIDGKQDHSANLFRLLIDPPLQVIAQNRVLENNWNQFDTSSLFLDNYGGTLSIVASLSATLLAVRAILFALQGGLSASTNLTGRRSLAVRLFDGVKNVLEWNLISNVVLSTFTQLFVAVILQLSSPSVEHPYEIAGSVVSNVATIGVFIGTSSLVLTSMSVKTSKTSLLEAKFSSIVKGYEDSKVGEWIPVLILSRAALSVLSVTKLAAYPFAQVSVNLLIHGAYLSVLLQTKVFPSKFMRGVNLAYEMTQLAVHAQYFTLIGLEKYVDGADSLIKNLGWGIMGASSLGMGVLSFYQVLQSANSIRKALSALWKSIRNRKRVGTQVSPGSVGSVGSVRSGGSAGQVVSPQANQSPPMNTSSRSTVPDTQRRIKPPTSNQGGIAGSKKSIYFHLNAMRGAHQSRQISVNPVNDGLQVTNLE